VVAPGPTPGSERLYASYLYVEDTFEVVSVDPSTGEFEVLPNPIQGEYGARSMVAGPDGNVYLGSLPKAHLLELDTKTQRLVDLGRPSATEEFIWDLAFGSDGRLYGGTYPNARLVRYDPRTRALEDLGRMDPAEQYARYVAASDDGFVYVGIGTSRMNVAAFRIASGERREILPEDLRRIGQAEVYRGADGLVYAIAGEQRFRLEGWTAKPVKVGEAAPRIPANRTRGGRLVSLGPGVLRAVDRAGRVATSAYRYPGRELPIFRIALGPDGHLYASTVLPARLLRLDEREQRFVELGELGGGEVYSFLSHTGRLLMAAYACGAPLLDFDPSRPFRKASGASNPSPVRYDGDDEGWRPMAMVAGPGKVYVGAIPGYGKLGGSIIAWDVGSGAIEPHPAPIAGHSVTALAAWKDKLVGGTGVRGGLGAATRRGSARLFVWDPVTKERVFDLEPVPGAAAIESLITAPNGLVYGIAGTWMFVVDIETRAVKVKKSLPFPGGTVYGALALGPDERIFGLGKHPLAGIFAIDPATNEIALVARPPKPITGGFALRAGFVYFVSGGQLFRYAPPSNGDPRR
jgi:hypothetical protein